MRTLSDSPGLMIAERDGLVVMLMRKSPDDLSFKACEDGLRDALTRQQRISSLILIPNFDGPTRASRERQKEFVEFMQSIADRHLGMAIVVGVPGVKGMMVRLTVNGVLMLSRLTRPVHLLASIGDALTWLRALPGQSAALSNPELHPELLSLR